MPTTTINGTVGTAGTNGANPTPGTNGGNAIFTQNGVIGVDSLTVRANGGKGGKGGKGTGPVANGATGGNGGNASISYNGNIATPNPAGTSFVLDFKSTGGEGGAGGASANALPGAQGNGGNGTVSVNGNILNPSKVLTNLTLLAEAVGGLGTQYGNASATVNGNIIQPTKATNVTVEALAHSAGPDSVVNDGNTAFGTKTATVNGNIVQGNINNVFLAADAYPSNGTARLNGNIVQISNPNNTGTVTLEAQGNHIEITQNKVYLGKQQLDLTIGNYSPYDVTIQNNEFYGTGTNTFHFTDNAIPGPHFDTVSVNLMTNSFVFNGQNNVLNNFANVTVDGDVNFTITGNNNNNILNGGNGNDFLYGLGGDDTLNGNGGDDFLEGGTGNDILNGGANGPAGDTASFADATGTGVTVDLGVVGPQAVGGGLGNDTLNGIENLLGSGFADTLIGDNNNNVLDGGAGPDTLVGKGGNDTLLGRMGADILNGGTGDDTLNGDGGNDTATYVNAAGGVTVNLGTVGPQAVGGGEGTDTLINIENVTGSGFDDILVGTTGTNILSGLAGNDLLIATAGGDTLDGGANGLAGDTADFSDALLGGVTVDLNLQPAPQLVSAEFGNTTLIGIENVIGTDFGDNLTGDGNNNALSGGLGNDFLIGNGGDDVLNAGDNDDAVKGGQGNDQLIGGLGVDLADFSDATSNGLTVNLNLGTATGGGLGNDTLGGIENLLGSAFNDTLIGDVGDNSIYGGGGNDIIIGGSGTDLLFGEGGDDSLMGGTGNDTIDGGLGIDTANYSNTPLAGVVVDLTIAGPQNTVSAGIDTLSGIENVIGSNFGDVITGDGNANFLSGLAGIDALNGGGGNDILFGGLNNDAINGGANTDVAYYAGRETQYVVTGLTNVAGGPDGTDSLTGVERLKFLSPTDVSDLDNNGSGDLIFQNAGNGNLQIRTQNPAAPATTVTGVGVAWKAIATGKFTADLNRNDSILLQNSTTQDLEVVTVLTGPAAPTAFSLQPGAGWQAIDVGDFNGDATSDVLLQNGGNVKIMFMDGTAGAVASTATFAAPAGFTAISGGDFNGDGKSDILWQNNATKDVQVSLMDGATTTSSATFATGPGYTAIGTGDFNNDGFSDILFQNGANAVIWNMNGTTQVGAPINVAPPVNPGTWTVAGAEDLDGNGYSDVIWHDNANGNTRATLMDVGGVLVPNQNFASPAATFNLIASTGGG